MSALSGIDTIATELFGKPKSEESEARPRASKLYIKDAVVSTNEYKGIPAHESLLLDTAHVQITFELALHAFVVAMKVDKMQITSDKICLLQNNFA